MYQRDDPELLMPYRWSPRVRDLWRTVMEEGRAIATMVETTGASPVSQEPKVENIRRHNGVAGQFSITAEVTYEGEETARAEFVGSIYGGPVVMVMPATHQQVFVFNPERHGAFGSDPVGWVQRFFEERSHA